jgi:hypothetical protein
MRVSKLWTSRCCDAFGLSKPFCLPSTLAYRSFSISNGIPIQAKAAIDCPLALSIGLPQNPTGLLMEGDCTHPMREDECNGELLRARTSFFVTSIAFGFVRERPCPARRLVDAHRRQRSKTLRPWSMSEICGLELYWCGSNVRGTTNVDLPSPGTNFHCLIAFSAD